jgi:hypothetical protein
VAEFLYPAEQPRILSRFWQTRKNGTPGASLRPIETSSGDDTCGTPPWKNGQTEASALSHSHPLTEGKEESPGLGEVALAAVSEAPVNTSCVYWRRSCVNWLVFTRFWVSQLVVLARADREGRERVLGLKKTGFLQNRERRYFFDLGSVRGGDAPRLDRRSHSNTRLCV